MLPKNNRNMGKLINQRTTSHTVFWPNPAVKGTRRPLAVVKVSGLICFVGFDEVLQPARPLL